MFEYHVEGFSNPLSYADWVEDMNSSFPNFVIDSVLFTQFCRYCIWVTFHYPSVPEEG